MPSSKRNHEVWLKFRANLKTAMQRKGLRGYELARAAGVWPTNVSHWLNDGSIPSGPVLVKLASALDMQPDELLPGAGKALRGKDGQESSAALTAVRTVLDELDVLLRELRDRWEDRSARGKAAEDHYQALNEHRQKAPRKRQSRGL